MSRLCLFDVDGTLLSFRPWAAVCFQEAAEALTGVRGDIRAVPFSGMTDPAILRAWLRRYGGPTEDFAALWAAFQPEYVRRVHARVPEGYQLTVYPGVRALLEALVDAGAWLGLVTGNVEEIGWLKVELAGLRDFFSIGAFGSDHEDRPTLVALALERAARRWGRAFPAPETWVIGDSPHDISAARAHGARVLAVATGVHPQAELAALRPDLCALTLEHAAQLLLEGTAGLAVS